VRRATVEGAEQGDRRAAEVDRDLGHLPGERLPVRSWNGTPCQRQLSISSAG
jgi:hypothetical protein